MRAVIVNEPGGFDALHVEDVPDPRPGEGEVLVEAAFAGCNWADTQVRSGIYPHAIEYPVTPGFEVSGTVAEVGAGVEGISVGDRVVAITDTGGYAEKAKTIAPLVTVLPENVPLDTAAAFPIQALTGYHMLHTVYQVKAGDVVLVHAAGGGVGLQTIQLAVHAGARVIGTVGTRGKEKKALEYGAERVVNLGEEDFVAAVMEATGGRGADLAVDSLGASTLDKTFDAVRLLGHVINIGEAEGKPYDNIRDRVLPRSQTFTRLHVGHVMPDPVLWKKGMDYVVNAVSDGWLDIPIVDRIPLDNVREMHERFEARGVSGKLLLAIA